MTEIEEGSYYRDMPRMGFGRIKTHASIKEWFVTFAVFGYQFFACVGAYPGVKMRFHVGKRV